MTKARKVVRASEKVTIKKTTKRKIAKVSEGELINLLTNALNEYYSGDALSPGITLATINNSSTKCYGSINRYIKVHGNIRRFTMCKTFNSSFKEVLESMSETWCNQIMGPKKVMAINALKRSL